MTTNPAPDNNKHGYLAEYSEGTPEERQIEATLAIAYEQRTANMLALYREPNLWHSAVLHAELGYSIKARLGVEEE